MKPLDSSVTKTSKKEDNSFIQTRSRVELTSILAILTNVTQGLNKSSWDATNSILESDKIQLVTLVTEASSYQIQQGALKWNICQS